MIKQLIGLSALVFAASTALPAAAVPLEGGLTATQVARVLQDKGYKAVIGVDDTGDPKVTSAAEGVNFTIFFYGCNHGPRCTSLTFQAGFHIDGGLTAEKINGWNRDKRWLKGWLDNTNDPFCDMDIDAEHGFSSELLDSYIDTWAEMLPAFKSYIGYD
ncbi:MAG TPA: YbjN domain-containing protein [Caulobacteraceae bacterium]|nr:YbjN domain-containing protein [Caulobacteraceae bacterium]